MGSLTAVLQLALALLASAQSTSTIAADVRQQAITTAASVIRRIDDAIEGQIRALQIAAPDPARAALDNYLGTLIGRKATVADLFPLSTDATKVSYLALGVPAFRDQTGVSVVSVAELATSTDEVLFTVTTHDRNQNETDTFPYAFLRSNGVWKYDLGEVWVRIYGQPMSGPAMTSLPVTLPSSIPTSTAP